MTAAEVEALRVALVEAEGRASEAHVYTRSSGWLREQRGPTKQDGGRLDVAATVAAWTQGGGR